MWSKRNSLPKLNGCHKRNIYTPALLQWEGIFCKGNNSWPQSLWTVLRFCARSQPAPLAMGHEHGFWDLLPKGLYCCPSVLEPEQLKWSSSMFQCRQLQLVLAGVTPWSWSLHSLWLLWPLTAMTLLPQNTSFPVAPRQYKLLSCSSQWFKTNICTSLLCGLCQWGSAVRPRFECTPTALCHAQICA